MSDDLKNDDYWKGKLSPDEYHVLRQKGTERAFSGEYWNCDDAGIYRCRACGEPLFESDKKFDAGCGWPSFDQPMEVTAIEEARDTSHGMIRTEVMWSSLRRSPRACFPRWPDRHGIALLHKQLVDQVRRKR